MNLKQKKTSLSNALIQDAYNKDSSSGSGGFETSKFVGNDGEKHEELSQDEENNNLSLEKFENKWKI